MKNIRLSLIAAVAAICFLPVSAAVNYGFEDGTLNGSMHIGDVRVIDSAYPWNMNDGYGDFGVMLTTGDAALPIEDVFTWLSSNGVDMSARTNDPRFEGSRGSAILVESLTEFEMGGMTYGGSWTAGTGGYVLERGARLALWVWSFLPGPGDSDLAGDVRGFLDFNPDRRPVPDSGASLALLAIGLCSLGLIRRKLAA